MALPGQLLAAVAFSIGLLLSRNASVIDGEMRAVDIQERFCNIRAVSELEPDPAFLKSSQQTHSGMGFPI